MQSTEIHAQKEQFDEELLESIVNQENNGEECDKESMEEKRVRDDLPSPVQRRKKPSGRYGEYIIKGMNPRSIENRIQVMRSGVLNNVDSETAHQIIGSQYK